MDLSVGVSTYVLMSAFLSADVAPGFGIRGEAGGEFFTIGAEFRGVLPSRTFARDPTPGTAAPYRTAEFDLSQLSALIVPCGRYKYFVGCGVAQFGWFITQSNVQQSVLASYSFGPRIGFDIPLGDRFSLFGFGEVLFAPSPAGIDFTGDVPGEPNTPPNNTSWTQSVASGFFGAGASIKFK